MCGSCVPVCPVDNHRDLPSRDRDRERDRADRLPDSRDSKRLKGMSGSMPGAVVTMSPAAAAVKFILAKGDLNRNARDTAGQIAKSVAARVPK